MNRIKTLITYTWPTNRIYLVYTDMLKIHFHADFLITFKTLLNSF